MKIKRRYFVWCLVCLLVVCSIIPSSLYAEATSSQSLKIKKIDFYIDNLHPLFYDTPKVNPNSQPRLYYNFYIYIDNLQNHISNIKEVQIQNGFGIYWRIDHKSEVNLVWGYIGSSSGWFDTVTSNNSAVLSIQDLKAVIIMNDGTVIEEVFSIPEPGALKPDTKGFVFADTYRGKMDDNYVPALKYGSIQRVQLKDDTFYIDFNINDSRVANGKLMLYDKKRNYIGESKIFINVYSREILDGLNQGKAFYTDGTNNTVELTNYDIILEKGRKANQIKYVALKLMDGNQFIGTETPDLFYYDSYSQVHPIE
ncbi:MAG TPA: hypothetical protein VEC37_01815 [Bacillota bacterium]|nr:hypothetical protein [Bacillota bacterium]